MTRQHHIGMGTDKTGEAVVINTRGCPTCHAVELCDFELLRSGFSPEHPDLFYQNNIKAWGPPLCEKRPEVTMDLVHDFLTSMYTDRADFVFTVSRDFVRSLHTPLLIAPDDIPAHPYAAAMEVADLAPNSEVTIFPWKDSQPHIDEVVDHTRRFLKEHATVKD